MLIKINYQVCHVYHGGTKSNMCRPPYYKLHGTSFHRGASTGTRSTLLGHVVCRKWKALGPTKKRCLCGFIAYLVVVNASMCQADGIMSNHSGVVYCRVGILGMNGCRVDVARSVAAPDRYITDIRSFHMMSIATLFAFTDNWPRYT